MKPGCFGSTIAHQPFLKPCDTCPLKDECSAVVKIQEPKVLERLAALDRIVTGGKEAARERVARFFARRWRKPPKPSEGMPKVARAVYDSILNRRIDLTDICRGINPMKGDTPEFMDIACEVAINESPFRSRDVQTLLMSRHNVQKRTATTLASRACSILVEAGAIKKTRQRGIFQTCK